MNLNELWHYDDPVDRWAAHREFKLRRRRYYRWLADSPVRHALDRLLGRTP